MDLRTFGSDTATENIIWHSSNAKRTTTAASQLLLICLDYRRFCVVCACEIVDVASSHDCRYLHFLDCSRDMSRFGGGFISDSQFALDS